MLNPELTGDSPCAGHKCRETAQGSDPLCDACRTRYDAIFEAPSHGLLCRCGNCDFFTYTLATLKGRA